MIDANKTRQVAEYWDGKGLLSGMVMEEAAELIQAINKFDRKGTEETRQGVIEEIGDLLLILDGYTQFIGISKEELEQRVEYKLSLKKEN